jgi:hypothetical protein
MANKFKSKGMVILNDFGRRPNSVEEFLEETIEGSDNNTQLQENTTAPIYRSSDSQLPQITNQQYSSITDKAVLGRLHIEIRQDLVEKLLELVYQRKKDPNKRGKGATQRAIIEEALEQYFRNS